MNYIKIDTCDLNNGDGVRVTLWVSGCTLRCNGCHNASTWDFNAGQKFTEKTIEEILSLLSDKFISGLSILGGEPLAPHNRETVLELCEIVKAKFPNKDIWLWTGYDIIDYNAIGHYEIPNVDYIIDGFYNKDMPTTKKWRGSDNQRMFKKVGDNLIMID